MNRRQVLQLFGTLPLAACAPKIQAAKMPVIFAAHGAPVLLDDAGWVGELARWAHAMPKPAAILVISAHWEQRPVTLGATRTVPLVYDFYGFPDRYYQQQYAAPGAPAVAQRVRELLGFVADDPGRGLDHGAYVPLVAMYPAADVPVLQLSMPGLDPQMLYRLGTMLAPLRRENVLIFGSGFLTHNMQIGMQPTQAWAREFDHWAEAAIANLDIDALVDFRSRAPAVELALPTWEHYAPLLVSLGALAGERVPVTFPITGFWNDTGFTRRSVQFG